MNNKIVTTLKYSIFIPLLLFSISISFGQNFKPIDTTDFLQRKELIEYYKRTNDVFNKKLRKKYSRDLRREIISYYEYSQNEFIQIIENREIVFDDRFSFYLDSISKIIRSDSANNSIKKFNLLLSRSNEANAFCLTDGTIIVHMGLFRLLENEEQLISVICHEIGHNQLEHPKNSLLKKAKINISTNVKEQVKDIKSIKRNQNDKAFSILKDILYSEGKEKRSYEMEADSLGFLLYKSTINNSSEFINALTYIRDIDSLPVIKLIIEDYKNVFSVPDQPFKEEWMKIEDYSTYNYDFYKPKINKDSISSHPEMDQRIEKLKHTFTELNSPYNKKEIDSTTNFFKLRLLAKQSVISNYYVTEQYGKSIYICLARLKDIPEDTALKKWLGENFQQLYKAKKEYTFNRYVEYITPEIEDESYQQFLSFLWNLNLQELKNISEYYLKKPNN